MCKIFTTAVVGVYMLTCLRDELLKLRLRYAARKVQMTFPTTTSVTRICSEPIPTTVIPFRSLENMVFLKQRQLSQMKRMRGEIHPPKIQEITKHDHKRDQFKIMSTLSLSWNFVWIPWLRQHHHQGSFDSAVGVSSCHWFIWRVWHTTFCNLIRCCGIFSSCAATSTLQLRTKGQFVRSYGLLLQLQLP